MSDFDAAIPDGLDDTEFVRFAYEMNKTLFEKAVQRRLDDLVPILRKAQNACEVLLEIREQRDGTGG